jgi:uncharacterized protein (DUF1697 family)
MPTDGRWENGPVPSHVALLRGINVGGRNRVSMEDLRAVVRALGHTEVSTYIQSGNVLFTPAGGDANAPAGGGSRAPDGGDAKAPAGGDSQELSREIERAIAEALDVAPGVVVLARAELAAAIEANPFAAESNPKSVHGVFHRLPLGADRVAEVAAAEERSAKRGSGDEAVVIGRTLYLRTPEGIGRSDLAMRLTRPTGAGRADAGTARNWATVMKLLGLMDA